MSKDTETNPDYRRFIVFRILRAHSGLTLQTNRILEKNGGLTSTQWRILAVMEGEGASTLSDIAEISTIDKGLLSRNLTPMLERGWITAQPDPHDGRIKRLSVSDEGRALHDRVLPLMIKRHERIARDLTDEERDALFTALDKIEAASKFTDF